jgi:hypothetical protein
LLLARLLSVRISSTKETTRVKDGLVMGVMIPKGTAVVVTSILVTALFIFLLERTSLARFAGVLFAGYPREVAPTPDGIGSDHA